MSLDHLAQPCLPYRTEFRAMFQQYRERDGQPFTVLGEVSTEEAGEIEGVDLEAMPMYVIVFPDGHKTHAWPEEVRLDYYVPGDPEYEAMERAARANPSLS